MEHPQKINNKVFLVLFAIAAVVILLDFALPGQEHIEKIESIRKTRQQTYNAARNFHYSYGLKTEHFYFPVSEKFAGTVEEKHSVRFRVSYIFKKVNIYESLESGQSGMYSLRLVSGLVVPILALIILTLNYKRGKFQVLMLIIRILLLFDLIYLIY